jgi:hypothetical protein
LPEGWNRCLAPLLQEAEKRFGPICVAGVYGVGDMIARADPTQPLSAGRIARVVGRGRMLQDGAELPARAAALDEPRTEDAHSLGEVKHELVGEAMRAVEIDATVVSPHAVQTGRAGQPSDS